MDLATLTKQLGNYENCYSFPGVENKIFVKFENGFLLNSLGRTVGIKLYDTDKQYLTDDWNDSDRHLKFICKALQTTREQIENDIAKGDIQIIR